MRACQEGRLRKPVAEESTGLDFEVDFTELESFGETTLSPKKKLSQDTTQKLSAKPKVISVKVTTKDTPAPAPSPPDTLQSPSASTLKSETEEPAKGDAPSEDAPPEDASDGDNDLSWADVEDGDTGPDTPSKPAPIQASGMEQGEETWEFATPAKRARSPSECSADSDESRLYIADMPSPHSGRPADKSLTPRPTSKLSATATVPTPPAPATPQPGTTPCPASKTQARKAGKRPRPEGGCDQLGQILRMQSAMLKHTPSPSARTQKTPRPTASPTEASSHSLVKPCVTSFLEGKELEDGGTSAGPTVSLHLNARQKCK